MISCGLNGFGRFGQHLLRYWLENIENTNFNINYINDDVISLDRACDILRNDPYLGPYFVDKIETRANKLLIHAGNHVEITYTNNPDFDIDWLGKPDVVLECSGKNTDAEKAVNLIKNSTRLVIVSATSLNVDQTLIYGHNHKNLRSDDKVVSYGSCTVNAYIPIANYLNSRYGVVDSSVNIIHNVPEYMLIHNNTLTRKSCTLEVVAPRVLDFLSESNFKVNYTLVPYTGVSMIDFRFRVSNVPPLDALLKDLGSAMSTGSLHGLYKLVSQDLGPEEHKFSVYSAIFIKPGIKVIGDNIYLQAYFDNENSVNRYYDLTRYAASMIE